MNAERSQEQALRREKAGDEAFRRVSPHREGRTNTMKTYLIALCVGLAACAGKTGPVGQEGPIGPQGAKGDQGDAGPQGPAGLTGEKGDPGTNGMNGKDGANGKSSVLHMTPEPPGLNCMFGGIKVQTCLDEDGDPTTTADDQCYGQPEFLCNNAPAPGTCTTVDGDVILQNSLDVQAFTTAGCTTINGNLIVGTVAGGTTMTSLVGLDALTKVTGDVRILSNADLAVLNIPNLVTIGGQLWIEGNAVLGSVQMGSLQQVGGIVTLTTCPQLTSVSMNSASVFGGLVVRQDTMLATFTLPALTTVGGDLSVFYDVALTSFSVPALTTVSGQLWVDSNTQLRSLGVARLSSITSIAITNNPVLPQCIATALHNANPSAMYQANGNNVVATCP
jgi:hypothetical protein